MEESERLLGTVVEQGPTPVMITNTAGDIEYVNPAFTQLTGYTPSTKSAAKIPES